VDLERLELGLLAAIAATCLVSIFAAQVLLALAIGVHALRLARGRARLEGLAVDAPLLAFATWTLLSASFSADPVASHESAKKLVLFALLYLAVERLADAERREHVVDAALLGGVALGLGAIAQYLFLGYDTLQNRPRSFLGHYMTASGLAMGVLVVAAARVAFRARDAVRPSRRDVGALLALGAGVAAVEALQARGIFAVEAERLFVAALAAGAAWQALERGAWPGRGASTLLTLVALPVSAWALVVSSTRSAWLGAVVGLGLVVALRAPRSLWLLPVGVLAVGLLGPPNVAERLTLSDASSRDRYYMWQAGLDMIRDKPVFGQGPGMIQAAYPAYRWPEAPNPVTPHLHHNALQIAAERGLPGLAWWLWLVAALIAAALRTTRRERFGPAWVGPASLALLAALMVAGLFEYNFGDSEILMFVLLVAALPFALERQRSPAGASA